MKENHVTKDYVWLIIHKKSSPNPNLSWSEAVDEALCFGWIDSTVKSLGGGKRRQYFCPRNPKGAWSALNKRHVAELMEAGLMHESGLKLIETAKANGAWTYMDDVEQGIIPDDLQSAFDANPVAYKNYLNFSRGYRKSYLSWLKQAKREATRQKRIDKIIECCSNNIKSPWDF